MPKYDPETSQLSKIIDPMVILVIVAFFLGGMFGSMYCVFLPRGNIYLTEYTPQLYIFFFPVDTIIVMFHFYVLAAVALNLSFLCGASLANLFFLCILLTQELRLGLNHYITNNSLRASRNLQLSYRSFQILNITVMDLMGKFLVVFNVAMMMIPINASFNLITHWDDMNFLGKAILITGAVLTFNFWMVILQLGKLLCVRGEKLLLSWKRAKWKSKEEAKLMSKFRKSCQLVLVRHEKIFVVRRITPFLYVKGVVRGIFRFLLTMTSD